MSGAVEFVALALILAPAFLLMVFATVAEMQRRETRPMRRVGANMRRRSGKARRHA